MNNKIKILFLTATPTDLNRLHLQEEAREIELKIEAASHRDVFEFKTHLSVRMGDLQETLLRHQPDILHFSGQGSVEDGIVLEDKFGHNQIVGPEELTQLFAILKGDIRLVVLNACYSKSQAQAISKVIDYTVGINGAIGDDAAVAFSASFYMALGFGRSVKEAFDLARVNLRLSAIVEDKIPYLIIRKGVAASEPFVVHRGSRNIRIGGNVRDSTVVDNNNSIQDRGGGDLIGKSVNVEPDKPWPRD
jgi:hypothetical protein